MKLPQRLVLFFTREGVEARILYRTKDGPGTVRRRREAEQLAREGLRAALEALEEGPVESVGEAGFTTREDTLCADVRGTRGDTP